jgi:hypothetical protein
MVRQKKKLPPSKKNYMEQNPTVSIVLTKKNGLKPFIDIYKYRNKCDSYGKAVKELLLWCKIFRPEGGIMKKGEVFIALTLNHDLKQFIEWYMKKSGANSYEDAMIRLLIFFNDARHEKTDEE